MCLHKALGEFEPILCLLRQDVPVDRNYVTPVQCQAQILGILLPPAITQHDEWSLIILDYGLPSLRLSQSPAHVVVLNLGRDNRLICLLERMVPLRLDGSAVVVLST